jgi:hypothetical protein
LCVYSCRARRTRSGGSTRVASPRAAASPRKREERTRTSRKKIAAVEAGMGNKKSGAGARANVGGEAEAGHQAVGALVIAAVVAAAVTAVVAAEGAARRGAKIGGGKRGSVTF